MSISRFDLLLSAENTLKVFEEFRFQVLKKEPKRASLPKEKRFELLSNLNIPKIKPFQWKLKRTFDLCSILAGIIFISPLLLLVSIAIKLDSRGPILFKQKRVGKDGKIFNMYKFRSMCINAEDKLADIAKLNESNDVMFKMENDPRVTRIGKFIRKFSIDELPQLFNVLKGEMSLVGPRPPLVSELNHHKEWHYRRFDTLPGLTGMWQVSGRDKIKDFDQVVNLDITYIKNWSLFLDIQILLKTIPVVIYGKAC